MLERWGQTFDLADSVGLMAWMRFARAAKNGLDSADIEAMDVLYTMLQACFTDDAWPQFEAAAMKAKASGDDLFQVVLDAVQVMNATRPTGRPSDSSDGSLTTSTSSAGDSSSPVIDELVRRQRPDLALIVTQVQESRASA